MGEKPSDYFAVSLCARHHRQQHSQGEETFWKAYHTLTGNTVGDLIDAFCKASPKAREIREVRNG